MAEPTDPTAPRPALVPTAMLEDIRRKVARLEPNVALILPYGTPAVTIARFTAALGPAVMIRESPTRLFPPVGEALVLDLTRIVINDDALPPPVVGWAACHDQVPRRDGLDDIRQRYGLDVEVDELLPPDVIELRGADGQLVRITDVGHA